MKRIFSTLCLALLSLTALADEGMWLPSLISSRIDDMRAKGFQLTAEDIYSINKASLKDAVMLFDDGCTAELISPEGLLITNHHCGYGAIQRLSSVEHDYLTDGFWAQSREEELPNENLNVKFLKRMEDITERLAAGESREEILEKARENGRYKASIEQMYYGNQQFLFVYEQFDDVRLVGTPPSSIGKFGGDTDNWAWPRHTGDFSMFRIYADKDNRPAAYSPDNVPYRSKKHFKISTEGIQEGDFTMIYGFPGNTQEYILSDAVDYIVHRSDPMKIRIRTERLDRINAAQEKDPAMRIMYAAINAGISNAWKKWQGEALGLTRLNTVASKQEYERAFQAWAQDKPEYRDVLKELKAEYARIFDAYFALELMSETIRTGELNRIYNRPSFGDEIYPQVKALNRDLFRVLYREYYDNCPQEYMVPLFAAEVERLGSPEAYAELMFEATHKEDESTEAPELEALRADIRTTVTRIFDELGKCSTRNLNSERLNELYTTYIKGLREWDTERAFYPDANLTLRVAYGKVGGYRYADGVYHKPYTTVEGILEKDNPEIYDYNIPRHHRRQGLRTLGRGDRRPHDRSRLLPCGQPYHRRQLRLAGTQRPGRADRREFRPHVALDHERHRLRPGFLPQHRARHPLRAFRNRPHRRRFLPLRRDGLRRINRFPKQPCRTLPGPPHASKTTSNCRVSFVTRQFFCRIFWEKQNSHYICTPENPLRRESRPRWWNW